MRRIAIAAAAIALLLVAGLLAFRGPSDVRYRNDALGYELRYPASWNIDIQSPAATLSPSRGQQEYVRLEGPGSQGAPSVVVAVNQQARWCETGLGQQVTMVTVGGRSGELYECSLGQDFPCRPAPACREAIYQFVLSFPATGGLPGIVLLGTPGNDATDIRSVFASLSFLK